MTRRSTVVFLAMLVAVWAGARPAADSPAGATAKVSAQPGGDSKGQSKVAHAIVVFVQMPNEKPQLPTQPWRGYIIPENVHVPDGGELWLYNLCEDPIEVEFAEKTFFTEAVKKLSLQPAELVVLHLQSGLKILNCKHDERRAMYTVTGEPFTTLPSPNLFVP